ncbi:hypothetical protein AC579_237 [Pseudocercospora musae]|uniref:Uncharacterized protein n=1 Tax=Pseudocercospora musae TaxID=113226 RepID=A0A139I4C7_9PEZI|nr:hypothetical protein AC579_237 [Pseudocercospora musae]
MSASMKTYHSASGLISKACSTIGKNLNRSSFHPPCHLSTSAPAFNASCCSILVSTDFVFGIGKDQDVVDDRSISLQECPRFRFLANASLHDDLDILKEIIRWEASQ